MVMNDVTLKAKEEGRVGYFSIVWDRWFVPYILGGLENVFYRPVGGTTKGVSVYLGYSPYFDRVGHLKMPMYYEMTINPNPYEGGKRSHRAVWEKKVPCPEVERIMRRTEGEETTATEKVGKPTALDVERAREEGRAGYFTVSGQALADHPSISNLLTFFYHVGHTILNQEVYFGYSPEFDVVGTPGVKPYYDFTYTPIGHKNFIRVPFPPSEVKRVIKNWRGPLLQGRPKRLNKTGQESDAVFLSYRRVRHSAPERYVGAPKWAQQKVRDWDPLDRSIAWPLDE